MKKTPRKSLTKRINWRRLVVLDDRREPICRRTDCDREENPTHWVDPTVAPEIKDLVRCADQVVAADGDYYTDAPECRQSVARLQEAILNLGKALRNVRAA